MNDLTKKLKSANEKIESLNNEIFKLRAPKVSLTDSANSMAINKILGESKEAMSRNIKRIQKEIKDAKSK